jgi:hypothetical protein
MANMNNLIHPVDTLMRSFSPTGNLPEEDVRNSIADSVSNWYDQKTAPPLVPKPYSKTDPMIKFLQWSGIKTGGP